MSNFLGNYKIDKLCQELVEAVKLQIKNGNATERDIEKFIEVLNNPSKLKNALRFL